MASTQSIANGTMASELEKNPKETREGLLFLARFAMKTKDYRYMLDYMKKLVKIVRPNEDLSENERDCFSSACKLLLDGHLDSWRHLAFVAADANANSAWRESAREYQEMIAEEISDFCKEIVEFIDRSVLFSGEGKVTEAMTAESRVFFKKMKGDYLGHAVMVKKGPERVKAVEAVLEAYNAAMEEALGLPEVNLTLLKLALNLALFHAEICESVKVACSVARGAVDMAKRSLQIEGEEMSSEITAVLEELQNNVDRWMAKMAVEVTSQNSSKEQEEVTRTCRSH